MRIIQVIVNILFLFSIFVLFPFSWLMRDGLGPDSTTSSGLEALWRSLSTFYTGLIILVLFVLLLVFQWLRRYRKTEELFHKNRQRRIALSTFYQE